MGRVMAVYEDKAWWRNASGAPDPTYRDAAARVLRAERMEREGRDNCRRAVRAMLAVADALGCDVVGRVRVRDRKSGEVSR